MDDKRALRELRQGSCGALEWLIERYAPYVSTVIYNIIGSSMTQLDVEEVSSDVFLALWNNADKADCGRLKAYLGSIARNKAKNKLRKFGEALYIEDDDIILTSELSPENAVIDKEQNSLISEAVLSMEHPDREIFLRYYYYYQGVLEIADEMNMKTSTVKSRLARGREKLKKILTQGGYFDGK